MKKLLPAYESVSKDELYSKIGSGIVTLDDLKKILKKNTKSKLVKYWGITFPWTTKEEVEEQPVKKINKNEPFVIRENIGDLDQSYVLAKCCNPIPGDEVVGFIDDYGNVSVHQIQCDQAIKMSSNQGNRVIPVKWTKHKILAYLVRISLTGYDRFGVFNNITTVISKELNVNIRNINLHSHDGIFEGTIDLYVHNTTDLNNLIMNLMKVKGIDSVNRVEVKE
jgi:GTP pyrophosphokinase